MNDAEALLQHELDRTNTLLEHTRKHRDEWKDEYFRIVKFLTNNEIYIEKIIDLRKIRETLALMAEGEGEDYMVYMKMAKSALNEIDTILAGFEE